MPAKTFYLSETSLAYISGKRGKNDSAALERIVQEHRQLLPQQKKKEGLAKLREGAALLSELDLPAEAIMAWVKVAIEDA